MPDLTKSSEYIIRDVFSTVNDTNNAQTYSTEEIIRAIYSTTDEALSVSFTRDANSLKVYT